MKLTQKEIKKCVQDKEWQKFRLSLKGLTTGEKLIQLNEWMIKNNFSDCSKVQTQNYKNALTRGGLL